MFRTTHAPDCRIEINIFNKKLFHSGISSDRIGLAVAPAHRGELPAVTRYVCPTGRPAPDPEPGLEKIGPLVFQLLVRPVHNRIAEPLEGRGQGLKEEEKERVVHCE